MTTRPPGNTLCVRPQTVKALRVYLRQSKEEQHQKESIPTQRGECARLAMSIGLAASWNARIEYVDIDRAGDDFSGREELARLLREASPGDTVLAWKQDRVGRDMIDAAAAIRELVKYRQCALYTAETGTTPVTLDSAEQTAMVMFRGMVAQGELERIRSRTRDSLRQRARDGFAAGTIPFGFRTVLVDPSAKDPRQTKKRIEIDEPHGAAIIRRIYAEYLDGSGPGLIAKRLNKEGSTSPRGRGWSAKTVWKILRNACYAGHWSHGTRHTVGRHGDRTISAPSAERDVIRVERPELAIVSPDRWAEAQTLQAARAKAFGSTGRAKYALSGTLRCDQCGGPMNVKVCQAASGWERRYYQCSARARSGKCENAVFLRADDCEQQVADYLRTVVLPQIEVKIRESIAAAVEEVVKGSDGRGAEAEQLKGEIETLTQERRRLVRLAAAADDTPEVVDALRENQTRAGELARALAVVARPAIEPDTAKQLEALAVGRIDRWRKQIEGDELREAIKSLFPTGLRLKIGPGWHKIEGAASVPTVTLPSGKARQEPPPTARCSRDRKRSPRAVCSV